MTPRIPPRRTRLAEDTSPEAEEVQARLFREMGSEGRMRAWLDPSEGVVESARRALQRRMPGAGKREIDLAFMGTCCGEDLAREVAAYLRSR